MPEVFADIQLILNSYSKDNVLQDKDKVIESPKVKVSESPKVKNSFAKNRVRSMDNFMKFQWGWTL
mgnify:FL=1|jgi:hypothetical protein